MSAENVARAMEETVSLMKSVKKARLLTSDELTDVTRRRRDFEYRLLAKGAPRSTFLSYASFERELAMMLKSRAKSKGVKKARTKHIVHQTAVRVNLVYSRAVRRFKGDSQLWLHYARHLIDYGSHRSANRVFGRALAMRPNCPDVWLAAIAFHADTLGDSDAARKLSMRALRAVPQTLRKPIYASYFRFELAFLCKAIARRVAMRLPVPETQAEVDVQVEEDENRNAYTDEKIQVEGDNEDASTGEDKIHEGDGEDEEMNSDGDETGNNDEEKGTGNASTEGDGKSTKKRARTLKYWQGGAPLIVLKEVTQKTKLSVEELVNDYWKVVVELPHSPWQLIESTQQEIVQYNPKQGENDSDDEELAVAYQVISATLPFDVAMAKLKNTPTQQEQVLESGTLSTGQDDTAPQSDSSYKAAISAVESAVEKAYTAVVEVLQDTRVEDPITTSLVRLFCQRAKPFLTEEQLDELNEELSDVKKRHAEDLEAAQNVTLTQVMESGTVDAWERHLARSKAFKGAAKSRTRNALLKFIMVPFRTEVQDQVAAIWVQWEDDWDRFVEGLDKLMQLPPLSERVLRAVLKVLKAHIDGDEIPYCIAMCRRVYEKLTSATKAKLDVDLWIEYTEFERDICMDTNKCNNVVWKANKSLSSNAKELFDEKLSIRLLKR